MSLTTQASRPTFETITDLELVAVTGGCKTKRKKQACPPCTCQPQASAAVTAATTLPAPPAAAPSDSVSASVDVSYG